MGANFPDRLRKAMPQHAGGEHPSADLLNGYAEHTLSSAESQQVLEHLSVCPECRDVVYLACGAMEVAEEEKRVLVAAAAPAAARAVEAETATARAAVSEKRVRWWAWAVPVTAVLVVGSVLLLGPFRSHDTRMDLAKSAPPPPKESEPAQGQPQNVPASASNNKVDATTAIVRPSAPKPQPETEATTVATLRASAKRRDEVQAKAEEKAKVSEGAFALKKQASNEANYNFTASGAKAADQSAQATFGAQKDSLDKTIRQTVEVTAAAPTLQTESGELATANRGAVAGVAPGAAGGVASGAIAQRSMTTARAANASLMMTWRITRGGSLEHFIVDAWRTVPSAPSGPFLSVTNFGKEVWAAGNNLALYHSGDDGAHWERLKLPEEVAGEIVQVTFTSVLDGTLATSTGQQWASHDGGKTWAKP